MKIFLILIPIFISCAGPTNPFGGEISISDEFIISTKASGYQNIKIEASPDRQYYNSPYNLNIKIKDRQFSLKDFKYKIVYNNKILNRWYKTEEIIMPEDKDQPIEIRFKNIRFLPGNKNKITFLYFNKNNKDKPIAYHLKVPECMEEFSTDDLNISPFKIKNSTKQNIINISSKYKYNPSLIAALIAQESSFNPKALSIAKALGLTQVTPVAHRQIASLKPKWQIYPDFERMNLLDIRDLLRDRTINYKNDWRLSEKKSIEGGLLYLNYLNSYWSREDSARILEDVFEGDPPKTDILLASYNSGAYRVKKNILRYKKNWLLSKNLKEARKYVMNIKSYCYSFHEESFHEK